MRIGAVGAMVHNPVQMVHVHWCTTLVHNPTPKGVEVVMCTRGRFAPSAVQLHRHLHQHLKKLGDS